MSVQFSIILMRMALFFFLAESPCVLMVAAAYPAHVSAIIVGGAIILAVPPGVVIARMLRSRSIVEFSEGYRRLEWLFVLASVTSLAGVWMTGNWRPPVGIAVSSVGMVGALGLLLKSLSARDDRLNGFSAPTDRGRQE